jgi:hypothetical protein
MLRRSHATDVLSDSDGDLRPRSIGVCRESPCTVLGFDLSETEGFSEGDALRLRPVAFQ